ncbi:MAG: hypothetical protein AAGF83_13975 [Cyanobacteria bacterium P01_G01_bin.67]
MSIIATEIRQFWMPGLNEIVGKQRSGLVKWLSNGEYYYISSPISQNQFTLDLSGKGFANRMLFAYAYDCNRMASAAFETMWSIEKSTKLPNSTAWLLIKSYYAAFYAGHAIIRMLGVSCSQLNKQAAGKVHEIAKLFENDNGLNISSSYYSCKYNQRKQELVFDNIKAKGDVHESFWNIFYEHIKQLAKSILGSPIILSQSQDIFNKLNELCLILCCRGHNGGNWLSAIRNRVNYRHELDAWFPHPSKGKQSFENMYNA